MRIEAKVKILKTQSANEKKYILPSILEGCRHPLGLGRSGASEYLQDTFCVRPHRVPGRQMAGSRRRKDCTEGSICSSGIEKKKRERLDKTTRKYRLTVYTFNRDKARSSL